MKKYYLLATALAALVSCSENEFIGDENLQEANGQAPISFGFDVPMPTRASGVDAATALGNQFIVWGEKNEINADETGANVTVAPGAISGSPDRSTHLVFPNYQVNWVNNPYSTTSNSHGWEYVGYTHSSNYQSHIQTCANPTAGTPTLNALNAVQTIKYWDNAASSYTFTAVSAAKHLTTDKTDIENGYVTIQKNTTGATVYDKGYKITATANADLSTLYISDRVSTDTKTSPVTLTFRNVLSQIRVGVYEIIPGYDISSITFYVNTSEETPTQTLEAKVDDTKAFGAVCPNVKGTGYADFLTVTYGNGTTDIENHPIITPNATSQNNLILGTNTSTLSTSSVLGKTATNPTWDTSGGTFTTVFPQINNSTNLTLKCDYTLYNDNTKETISITGKTATVPAQYLQWKPNYKYTYLFKITDDDLSPITFDAVEIVAEDGNVEYITTVSEPSITTYANKSNVTVDNEYLTGSNIYVAVMEGVPSTNKTLTVGTNAKLYKATAEDGFVEGITENTVANALKNGTKDDSSSPTTWTLTDAGSKTMVVSSASGLTAFTTIPAADSPSGAVLTINGAYFTPIAPTFTAQTPAGTENPSTEGWYERSEEAGSYVYTITTDTTVDSGKTYYKKTATTAGYYVFEYTYDTDKKAYKVIKVVDKY